LAIGTNALGANTTGNSNVALGSGVLDSNTTASNNIAIGANALTANTTASNNLAIGNNALGANTTGASNIALGTSVLDSNTTASNNVAIGVNALTSNTIGDRSIAIGTYALDSSTTGVSNIAIGYNALTANTTASYNIAIGDTALGINTTGTQNTAIGYSSLNNATSDVNVTGLGYNTAVTGSNQVQLGNSATTTYAYGAVQNRSDIRDKADVRDTTLGLEFVNALRPVDFKWDLREDYRAKAPELEKDATEEEKIAYKAAKDKWLEDVKLANITHDGSKKRSRFHHGLIAQEVKLVLDAKGIDFGGFQDHSVKDGDDVLSIGYEELIAPMLKAIQELSVKVAELEAK
jgi:hypothetical protein